MQELNAYFMEVVKVHSLFFISSVISKLNINYLAIIGLKVESKSDYCSYPQICLGVRNFMLSWLFLFRGSELYVTVVCYRFCSLDFGQLGSFPERYKSNIIGKLLKN